MTVINKTYIISFFLLLICPIMGLILIAREIVRRQNWEMLGLLAFFMGVWAMVTPPAGDLFNHAMLYRDYLRSLNTSFIQGDQDYVLYTMAHFFAQCGIPFECIRGIYVFICYLIAFSLFRELMKANETLAGNRRFCLIAFYCFLLIVPFIWIVIGLRSATSCYLMIYAWLSFYRCRYVVGGLCALLGCFTHFFGWIFIPFLCVWPFLRRIKISYTVFLIGVVVMLALGKTVFGSILGGMSQDNLSAIGTSESSIDYYVGGGMDTTQSTNGLIAMIMERLPLIVCTAYMLLKRKVLYDERERTFAYLLVWLLCILVFYYIPIQRISWLVGPILMFFVLKNSPRNVLRYRLQLLFSATFLLQMAYVYGYRNVLLSTPFQYIFYPLPIAMFHTYPLSFRVPL